MMEISNLHERGEFVAATDVAERLADETTAADDEVSSAFALPVPRGVPRLARPAWPSGTEALERAAALFEAVGRAWGRSAPAPSARCGRCSDWRRASTTAPTTPTRCSTGRGAVVPPEDGYGRCLVAATAAMADQLADDPATVRAAVEPVWALAMDLGSDFWFSWAQALLGWAVAADDARGGSGDDGRDGRRARRRCQTRPYFLYLLGGRLCEHGRTAEGLARLDEGLAEVDAHRRAAVGAAAALTRARWMAASGDPAGEHGRAARPSSWRCASASPCSRGGTGSGWRGRG